MKQDEHKADKLWCELGEGLYLVYGVIGAE